MRTFFEVCFVVDGNELNGCEVGNILLDAVKRRRRRYWSTNEGQQSGTGFVGVSSYERLNAENGNFMKKKHSDHLRCIKLTVCGTRSQKNNVFLRFVDFGNKFPAQGQNRIYW